MGYSTRRWERTNCTYIDVLALTEPLFCLYHFFSHASHHIHHSTALWSLLDYLSLFLSLSLSPFLPIHSTIAFPLFRLTCFHLPLSPALTLSLSLSLSLYSRQRTRLHSSHYSLS